MVDVGNINKYGNKHGFIPSHSKTDNFKVGKHPIIEIDTRFFLSGDYIPGDPNWKDKAIDGPGVTWIDTVGASNNKFAYWAPWLDVWHEAHVEAVETGTHTIVIENGLGYKVKRVHLPNGKQIKSLRKYLTVWIDVEIE